MMRVRVVAVGVLDLALTAKPQPASRMGHDDVPVGLGAREVHAEEASLPLPVGLDRNVHPSRQIAVRAPGCDHERCRPTLMCSDGNHNCSLRLRWRSSLQATGTMAIGPWPC